MGRSAECARLWEVDAYREGRLGEKDADSFERHARTCEECGTKLARDERLGLMARELAERGGPTPLALRRLRVRVLRDAAAGEGSNERAPWWGGRRAAAVGVLALAAAAAAAVVLGGGHRIASQASVATQAATATATAPAPVTATTSGVGLAPEVYAGSVAELGDAHWTQTRADGVERVALAGGSVRVHVRPQQQGERFLVSLPDGEIEVRGTTFDVGVAAGATTRVHVDEGVVDLRLTGRDEVRLEAGDTWTATPAQPAASRPPVARVQPSTSVAAPALSAPAPTPVDVGESAYASAVSLLRDGRNAEAAAAFQAFVIAHPQAPQAEDASYLEAVALARAGRVDAAALAAEQHLARFPGSFHRRDAEALIARARVSGSR